MIKSNLPTLFFSETRFLRVALAVLDLLSVYQAALKLTETCCCELLGAEIKIYELLIDHGFAIVSEIFPNFTDSSP